jgi:hypothetical protein
MTMTTATKATERFRIVKTIGPDGGTRPLAVDLDSRRDCKDRFGQVIITLWDAYTEVSEGRIVLGFGQHEPFLGDPARHCYRYSVDSLRDGEPAVGEGEPILASDLPDLFELIEAAWAVSAKTD